MKSGSASLTERVGLVLSALGVLTLEPPADRHYGEIRHHLASTGMPIGPKDLLITAQARAADLRLSTANLREFDACRRCGWKTRLTPL